MGKPERHIALSRDGTEPKGVEKIDTFGAGTGGFFAGNYIYRGSGGSGLAQGGARKGRAQNRAGTKAGRSERRGSQLLRTVAKRMETKMMHSNKEERGLGAKRGAGVKAGMLNSTL